MSEIAAPTEGVVVGVIRECEQHPDADKLVVCKVDAGGEELLQIVCGAPNARVGLVAPVATVGGKLGEEFKIKKVKLRGVESHGMLCSAKELGMGEDHSACWNCLQMQSLGRTFVNTCSSTMYRSMST